MSFEIDVDFDAMLTKRQDAKNREPVDNESPQKKAARSRRLRNFLSRRRNARNKAMRKHNFKRAD